MQTSSGPKSIFTFKKCNPPGRCLAVCDTNQRQCELPLESFVLPVSPTPAYMATSMLDNTLSRCRAHLEGFLCHKCSKGYFRSFSGAEECRKCPQFLIDNDFLGKLVSAFLFIVVMFWWAMSPFHAKSAMSYQHVISTCHINRWVPVLRHLNRVIPSLYSILPFLQMVTLITQLTFDWPKLLISFVPFFTILNLNLNLTLKDCFLRIPYRIEWGLFVSVPWCTMCLNLIFWMVVKLLGSKMAWIHRCFNWMADEKEQTRYKNSLIADVWYVFYATTIPCFAEALLVFKCDPLHDAIDTPHFLRVQPSLICWQSEHIFLLVMAVMILVFYIIGMPCTLAYLLFKVGHGQRDTPQFRARYGFIYARYRYDRFWWHLVVLLRQAAIIAVRTFAVSSSVLVQVPTSALFQSNMAL